MALVATAGVVAGQVDQGQQFIDQSKRWIEGQQTNEKLNNPRPGDRIMKDNADDQDYYYYDGGRWNKHSDIFGAKDNTRERADEQRLNEKLNKPRPGDRIFKNDADDQKYYYYDGGRWNKHDDIWGVNGNKSGQGRKRDLFQ